VKSDKPSILFLCIHNAGRSQMALGWLRELGGDRVTGYSAGSQPAEMVNPMAVWAMNEVGIDIEHQMPKRWTDAMLQQADVVVTMGCGDECPFVPGTRYEDWEFEDPRGKDIGTVRAIRDEIREHVAKLLADLGVPSD
jgi:protein-tyrosine-phosphatase